LSSSSSESDDNSDDCTEEGVDGVEDQEHSLEDADAENDVDDETMFGRVAVVTV
jgi:hypothetical protein